MNLVDDLPDLEWALCRIRNYAQDHGLTPQETCDFFSVGISASSVLKIKDTSYHPGSVQLIPKK